MCRALALASFGTEGLWKTSDSVSHTTSESYTATTLIFPGGSIVTSMVMFAKSSGASTPRMGNIFLLTKENKLTVSGMDVGKFIHADTVPSSDGGPASVRRILGSS